MNFSNSTTVLRLWVTMIILFSCFVSNAQVQTASIGVKLYPGFSTLHSNFLDPLEISRPSISGGIEYSRQIDKSPIHFVTGAFLLDKGFKFDGFYTDSIGNPIEEWSAIERDVFFTIPLAIRLQRKYLYLGAGANINYLVGRKYIVNGDVVSRDKSYLPRHLIFGAQAEAGYQFRVSENIIISIDAFVNPTFDTRFVNYGFGVSSSYVWPVKKH